MPAFGSIIWNVLALLLDDDMGLFLGDSAMALPRSLFLDRRDPVAGSQATRERMYRRTPRSDAST